MEVHVISDGNREYLENTIDLQPQFTDKLCHNVVSSTSRPCDDQESNSRMLDVHRYL